MSKGPARRIRLQARVAFPVISATLVASIALAVTPSAASPEAPEAPKTPTATTTASATPSSTASAAATPSAAAVTPSPTALASKSSGGVVTPGVPVDHHVVGRIEGSGSQARYLAVDAPLTDAAQFQMIRLRFKLHNDGAVKMTAAPQLEYRASGSTVYTVVPEQTLRGIPFRVDNEWVRNRGAAGGTKQGPIGEDIPLAKFITGNEGGGLAVIGHHSMGANPDREITLPPASYTEQEFTIKLTMDAKYLTGYQFRITDGHKMLAGTQVATVSLGLQPALKLSPGQQNGLAVAGPKPARRTGAIK